jgi:hypothetical protein
MFRLRWSSIVQMRAGHVRVVSVAVIDANAAFDGA